MNYFEQQRQTVLRRRPSISRNFHSKLAIRYGVLRAVHSRLIAFRRIGSSSLGWVCALFNAKDSLYNRNVLGDTEVHFHASSISAFLYTKSEIYKISRYTVMQLAES